jgi:CubicO group peptidase (beta-lactamase class C family)
MQYRCRNLWSHRRLITVQSRAVFVRRSFFLLTIAALLATSAPAAGQAPTYAYDVFGAYVEALRVQAGIPGLAVAVVGEDGILWEHPYGRQDLTHASPMRTDTPFHVNGITESFTAAILLRCVEERRLSLDDRIGKFQPDSPEAGSTIRQLLTHTSEAPEGPVFAYRPERFEPLRVVARACSVDSYRETLANLLERFAMMDSVPGPDVTTIAPPAEGIPDANESARYTSVLKRLATPYAVDSKGRASASQYSANTLTPANGLISTVRDLANFDLALRQGFLEPDTLAEAWRPPVAADNRPLPHGLGWFVQSYNNEAVVWQFGLDENASSAMTITVPGRKLTLIMMANSDRLAKPFALDAGDVTVSPFGKLFLSFFVR